MAACLNDSDVETYPAALNGVISVANCSNEYATISYVDGIAKNKLRKYTWHDTSTSSLTAYTVGKLSISISKNIDIEDTVKKLK